MCETCSVFGIKRRIVRARATAIPATMSLLCLFARRRWDSVGFGSGRGNCFIFNRRRRCRDKRYLPVVYVLRRLSSSNRRARMTPSGRETLMKFVLSTFPDRHRTVLQDRALKSKGFPRRCGQHRKDSATINRRKLERNGARHSSLNGRLEKS